MKDMKFHEGLLTPPFMLFVLFVVFPSGSHSAFRFGNFSF